MRHLLGRRLLAGVMLGALGVAAGPAAGGGRQVTVFAASSLSRVFQEMRRPFEQANPGLTVRFQFAASSLIRTQIEQGATPDLFASADSHHIDTLVERGLVEPPRIFARNRLALVVPRSNPGRLRSAADLARPRLRLVAARTGVPIATYTNLVLNALARLPGYPRDLGPRFDAAVISREPNVGALLTRVELGEADGAFVYASDAHRNQRVRVIPIPAAAHVVVEYPCAVLKNAPERAGGEAFQAFLLGKTARALLLQHGFR